MVKPPRRDPPIRLSGGPPSVNRLGPPRRGDTWEWERLHDPTSRDQVELLGLGVMVTVMERMSPAERRRCLVYLVDRYGRGHLFGDVPRFDPDADGDQHP